jgi:hypothetical protein
VGAPQITVTSNTHDYVDSDGTQVTRRTEEIVRWVGGGVGCVSGSHANSHTCAFPARGTPHPQLRTPCMRHVDVQRESRVYMTPVSDATKDVTKQNAQVLETYKICREVMQKVVKLQRIEVCTCLSPLSLSPAPSASTRPRC